MTFHIIWSLITNIFHFLWVCLCSANIWVLWWILVRKCREKNRKFLFSKHPHAHLQQDCCHSLLPRARLQFQSKLQRRHSTKSFVPSLYCQTTLWNSFVSFLAVIIIFLGISPFYEHHTRNILHIRHVAGDVSPFHLSLSMPCWNSNIILDLVCNMRDIEYAHCRPSTDKWNTKWFRVLWFIER